MCGVLLSADVESESEEFSCSVFHHTTAGTGVVIAGMFVGEALASRDAFLLIGIVLTDVVRTVVVILGILVIDIAVMSMLSVYCGEI